MLTDDPADIINSRWNGDNDADFPVVEILWLDAVSCGADAWLALEEVKTTKPTKSLSVGYLIKSKKNYVTIMSMVNTDTVGHVLTIPRGMILEIRYLSNVVAS